MPAGGDFGIPPYPTAYCLILELLMDIDRLIRCAKHIKALILMDIDKLTSEF